MGRTYEKIPWGEIKRTALEQCQILCERTQRGRETKVDGMNKMKITWEGHTCLLRERGVLCIENMQEEIYSVVMRITRCVLNVIL